MGLFGPKVELVNNKVKIIGFPIYQFRADLKRKWKTSKLLNLYELSFNWYNRNGTLVFHEFFLPEMVYILDQFPKRKMYADLKKELYKYTWLSQTIQEFPNRVDFNKLRDFKRTLKPWQQKFLEVYDQRRQQYNLKGYLNAFEQGLGKSTCAIALMHCLNKDKIIIVAPNNTIYATWVNEISECLKDTQKIWTQHNPINNARWYLINYESMNKVVELANSGEFKNSNVGIVIDEIHHFRNKDTDRSQNAFKLAELTQSTDILAMSGTPIKALGSEMLPLMRLIDPLFHTEIEDIFKDAFGMSSIAVTDVIANRLGIVMFRLTKDEVMTMPEKTEETIKVKIPNGKKYTMPEMEKVIRSFTIERQKFYSDNKAKYEKDYRDGLAYFEQFGNYDKEAYEDYKLMVRDIINNTQTSMVDISTIIKTVNVYEKNVILPVLPGEIKKLFRKAKSVVKYSNLVIMGEVLGGILPKYRAELYKEIIEYGPVIKLIQSGIKKSIIFTTYGSVVENSEKILKKNKFNPVLVYQKTAKDRDKNIKLFKENEKINPMVTTIQMMSTGVTLNEANVVIFAPTPFRYTDYEQAYSRCYRIGQTDPVFIYTLVLDTDGTPNLSTRIDDISNWSKELFQKIVGVKVDKIDLEEVVEVGQENMYILPEEKDLWLSAYDIL